MLDKLALGENMSSCKPDSIGGYLEWLKETHNITVEENYQLYYDSVVNKVKRDMQAMGFWQQLVQSLVAYDHEYQIKTGYQLFMPKFEPDLAVKPFDSFLLKTYRKNVLENELWPNEPKSGWILPPSWFSQLNDLVRTLFVVRYFDGVGFLLDKISSCCKQHNMDCEISMEAREEGYYAAHLYTRQSFEIPRFDWDTERVSFSFEIQITTQLQEVIRKLLHKYYEEKRKAILRRADKWQWDYRCDEFSANYLGHILHYVEGMIMEVREKQRGA